MTFTLKIFILKLTFTTKTTGKCYKFLASDGHIFVGEVILTDVLIEVKLVHDSYIVQKLVMGISYMYFTFQRNLFYNTNQ